MASIAYNTLPANVAFTNVTPQEAINDPGAEVRGVQYKDQTVRIPLFQLNSFIALAAGDTVTLKAITSEEIVYYKGLEKEGVLTVEVTAVE